MKSVILPDGDWQIVQDALDIAYEDRCEDADEGGAERVADIKDEIERQVADR